MIDSMPSLHLAVAPGFSILALATMVLMLVASTAIYIALVRRETHRRHWVTLGDWARSRGARLRRSPGGDLPDSLAMLRRFSPQANLLILGPDWMILEATTAPSSTAEKTAPRWHLLAKSLAVPWASTGLRPVQHTHSFLDLFSLSSYPSLAPTGRFMLFGSESSSARALAQSRIETQLPPDIGLILTDSLLLLDFSVRHFDTIEFGRMLALSKQLSMLLPVVELAAETAQGRQT